MISSKSWSSVAIQNTGTKLCSGNFSDNSSLKLITEIILYKKYKGPVNKFNWCPVVTVNVFSCNNASIFVCVASDASILAYWLFKASTNTSLCFFVL